MAVYTFYYLNADGSVPAFEFDECRHDAEAVNLALERLDGRPEREAVEVRRGQRLIYDSRVSSAA